MTLGPMAEALAPFRVRMPRQVREREILRVAAALEHTDAEAAMQRARREVLAWAQKRSGSPLPKVAWDGEGFEHMPGGRTTLGARIREKGSDLWALRGDDPDKTVPGRTWTTEVAIGRAPGDVPRLSLRLMLSTTEDEPEIEPAVPGLLRQIAAECGLRVGGWRAEAEPWRVQSQEDLDRLVAMLEARDRELPAFVASGDERTEAPDQPLIDATALARATLGLAHVVIVPAWATYGLSDAFGKIRSVYHGAVRIYLPGFDSASDPYEHELTLGETIRRDVASCMRRLRSLAAAASLRRTRLGHDVMPFAAVRSAALRIEQEAGKRAGASEAEQLTAAQRRIDAMQVDLEQARNQAALSLEEAVSQEDRAKLAETRLRGALARIQQLSKSLDARGQDPDKDRPLPKTWSDLIDWCDQDLAGRLVLAPTARNGIKKAAFADVTIAARCLLWLAGDCRDRRINGGGSIANVRIGQGIENAPCGADTFTFDLHGLRLAADWHVKNGGNTREPRRCLRIYYAWEETTQQIVVADMPAHRRTGAT